MTRQTLSDIAGNYDAILSDVWGVVHNGIAAHPDAVDALRRFRRVGAGWCSSPTRRALAAHHRACSTGLSVTRDCL